MLRILWYCKTHGQRIQSENCDMWHLSKQQSSDFMSKIEHGTKGQAVWFLKDGEGMAGKIQH